MIDYEILVQTIADWKAGVRPTAPLPPAASVGAPESVEELSSGVVDFDEEAGYASEGVSEAGEAEEYEVDYGEGGYSEGEYSESEYAAGYDESQYQQAPTETYDEER